MTTVVADVETMNFDKDSQRSEIVSNDVTTAATRISLPNANDDDDDATATGSSVRNTHDDVVVVASTPRARNSSRVAADATPRVAGENANGTAFHLTTDGIINTDCNNRDVTNDGGGPTVLTRSFPMTDQSDEFCPERSMLVLQDETHHLMTVPSSHIAGDQLDKESLTATTVGCRGVGTRELTCNGNDGANGNCGIIDGIQSYQDDDNGSIKVITGPLSQKDNLPNEMIEDKIAEKSVETMNTLPTTILSQSPIPSVPEAPKSSQSRPSPLSHSSDNDSDDDNDEETKLDPYTASKIANFKTRCQNKRSRNELFLSQIQDELHKTTSLPSAALLRPHKTLPKRPAKKTLLFTPPPLPPPQFPHRHVQIRLLTRLLASWKASKVTPAPLFVTGPGGTGKTSVVKHVVSALNRNGRVGTAVIDGREVGAKKGYFLWKELLEGVARRMMLEDAAIFRKEEEEEDDDDDESQSSCSSSEEEEGDDWERTEDSFRDLKHKRRKRLQGTIPILAFGRALPSKKFMVLIIDHAERLLQKGHNDALTQLLLLPKELNVRLAVICISEHGLLADTRVNTRHDVLMFPGSKREVVQPVTVYFEAYSQDQFFDILSQPHFVSKILPPDPTPQDKKRYASLLQLLIPTLVPYTRDVREIFRLTRLFYPRYVSDPAKARSFLPDLLKMLSLPSRSNVPSSLTTKTASSSSPSLLLPTQSQYLILASYICQQNHFRCDVALYTKQRQNKKRRRTTSSSATTPSSSSGTFPVERLLSAFSIIMRQHCKKTVDSNLLWRELAVLRELGLLRWNIGTVAGRGVRQRGANSSSRGGVVECLVRDREAQELAKSLGFPLDRHLM